MLNQSFFLEVVVNEHHNDLLKEANVDLAARQRKEKQFRQSSRLKRFVAFLNGLQIGAVRPVADQASLFKDELFNTRHL